MLNSTHTDCSFISSSARLQSHLAHINTKYTSTSSNYRANTGRNVFSAAAIVGDNSTTGGVSKVAHPSWNHPNPNSLEWEAEGASEPAVDPIHHQQRRDETPEEDATSSESASETEATGVVDKFFTGIRGAGPWGTGGVTVTNQKAVENPKNKAANRPGAASSSTVAPVPATTTPAAGGAHTGSGALTDYQSGSCKFSFVVVICFRKTSQLISTFQRLFSMGWSSHYRNSPWYV